MRRLPAVVVASALLAGDAFAGVAALALPAWAVGVWCAGSACLLFVWRGWRVVGVASAAALVGFLRASAVYLPAGLPQEHVAHLALPAAYALEARVVSGNLVAGQRATIVVEVLRVRRRGVWERACGRVRISVREAQATWAEGEVIRGFFKLRRPRDFGNPGEFAYTAHLARQGIYVTAWVDRDADWERVAGAGGLGALWVRWRQRVAALFAQVVPEPSSAILRALIVGDQSGIAPTLRAAFSRIGVGHVLSISGLHVALVAGAGYVAARWILSRSEALLLWGFVPKLAAASSLVPVLLYATIAGDNVATRRAVLMLVAGVGALLGNRQAHLLNVLALAAIAVVLTSPGATGDISFQLSFSAVWALVAASAAFRRWWPVVGDSVGSPRERPRWQALCARAGRALALSLWLTTAATVATAPLTAWHFNQLALAAPWANLCIVPLLGTVAVLAGLAAAFTEPVSDAVAALWARAAGVAVRWGCELTQWFAQQPWAGVRVPTLPAAAVAACLLLLAAVAHGGLRLRAAALALLASVLLVNGLVGRGGPWERGRLAVTFLSVGQANAALVEFPEGSRWLVDGGGLGAGRFDTGERVLAPALWSKGIRSLHAIVLTHPQFDHYGGLAALVPLFSPPLFLHNGRTSPSPRYRQLQHVLARAEVTAVGLYRGFEWCVEGVHVSVWHPQDGNAAGKINDESLVLLLSYAGRTVLLPGDVEARGEDAVLQAGPWTAVDVLAVPHHGSRTSSTLEFVATLRPRLAVVSAGWHNRFRFPHAEVRRRYAASGSVLLRTDWDGAVEVVVFPDGTLRWRTSLPPWNAWHAEPLPAGPQFWGKFVDSTCAQG